MRDTPVIDGLDRVVARLDRFYEGLEVVGGDVIAIAALEQGLPVADVVSRLDQPLSLGLQPVVSETAARTFAEQALGYQAPTTAELVIWAIDSYRSAPRLAWDVAMGAVHIIIAADDGSDPDPW